MDEIGKKIEKKSKKMLTRSEIVLLLGVASRQGGPIITH